MVTKSTADRRAGCPTGESDFQLAFRAAGARWGTDRSLTARPLPSHRADPYGLQLQLRQRLRRGAVIVTNLRFADWAQVLVDERLTVGLLDRDTHRAHILDLQAESYRTIGLTRRQDAQNAQSKKVTRSVATPGSGFNRPVSSLPAGRPRHLWPQETGRVICPILRTTRCVRVGGPKLLFQYSAGSSGVRRILQRAWLCCLHCEGS